jgi:alkyl hydroperoxide reductase subunit AhpC
MSSLVQKPAPDWKATAVVNGEFKQLSLSDFRGKSMVLFFYPLDFTFVCPTELVAFNDKLDDFKKIGVEVIGCSVDSEHTHLAWLNTPRADGGIQGMKYPLLADLKKDIARDYGVLLEDGIALRGLFVLDDKHTVRHVTVNDLPIGRSVDEVLRVVQAMQFADKHGEVCPADWRPGKDSMKADPKGSKAYFKKAAAR